MKMQKNGKVGTTFTQTADRSITALTQQMLAALSQVTCREPHD
jgi:hypothetical protein